MNNCMASTEFASSCSNLRCHHTCNAKNRYFNLMFSKLLLVRLIHRTNQLNVVPRLEKAGEKRSKKCAKPRWLSNALMSSAIQRQRHQLTTIVAVHPPAWSMGSAVDNIIWHLPQGNVGCCKVLFLSTRCTVALVGL